MKRTTCLVFSLLWIASCSGSADDAATDNALLPAETPVGEDVIPENPFPIQITEAEGELPAGAPADVRRIPMVTLESSSRATISFVGNANQSGTGDPFRAKYFMIQRSNGSSGQSCGTWRTAAEITKTGFEPGETYSAFIKYENGTQSPKISFTMPQVTGDTTPPVLAANGFSYSSCSHSLYINGSDDTGIATVIFYNGDTEIGGDMGGMFGFRDCTKGTNGECTARYATHISVPGGTTIQVRATAYDFSGNAFTVGPYPMTIP